ncbi:hypothetical protein [Sanyastnella coralliicola]|uniref:hypothetical protein n=1 Tax=Sanyastnella coralliicola TaxID=3069118 RepID=UPI0027B942D3|nr:hypothetical protein [Longitalea sp. SCSIO 12813]
MNRIILFLFVAVGLASCGPDLVAVAVDNPTNDYIEVSIDSLNVEIPPRDVAWVEMGHGVHVITVPGEEPVEFDFVQDMYMMNPSHSEYIMYEEIYGTMGAFATSSIPEQTVNFLGMEFDGPYKVIGELVNPIEWDYGPRETTPEVIEVDASESYASLLKLADEEEFLMMMMAE